MRHHRSRLRIVLAITALMALLLLGAAESASAAQPWWHLATLSAPAAPHSSEGQVILDAANLGDGPTPGTVPGDLREAREGHSAAFVRITDTLPEGVTPERASLGSGSGETGGLGGADSGPTSQLIEEMETALGHPVCAVTGQVVACTYAAPVRSYEEVSLVIDVQLTPGSGSGVNEASVSGAGTRAVIARRPLALEAAGGYGVQDYELTPEEEGGLPAAQAGSHPFQLTTTLMLNAATTSVRNGSGHAFLQARPVALTKDLRFDLPPGLIGNPAPIPKCSLGVFLQPLETELKHPCPNDTVVGATASVIADGHNPKPVYSPVYSLEPSAGEPAKFGFDTIDGPVLLDTSVRTGGGYGVVVTVPNIPSQVPFLGSVLTFWGVPADHRHDNSRNRACLEDLTPQESGAPEPACSPETSEQPFLIMPTSCTGPLQTSVEGDSWSDIGVFTSPFSYATRDVFGEPFGMDGCNRLAFNPSISVSPDGQQGSSPTGLSVGVHVDQEASLNPAGDAEAQVRDTTVTLPPGVVLNPAASDGLLACGLAEISLESPGEQSCPEASKVATVEIRTPLLPNPLTGAAYLATPAPLEEPGQNPFSSLLALYIVARDPVSGVLVKLAGEVKPDAVTGQLTSTFDNTPQLPFEDLKLHFFGGSRAPLGTPPLCGSYAASASIVPWSGNPPAELQSPPFQIVSGPDGSPCGSPLPFAPSLAAGSSNVQAGAFTPFSTTMSREDGQQNLRSIQLHMPPGLSGDLAGVELCPEPQAGQGTCAQNSLIGETTVSVGLGATPFSVSGGKVYLTGPYEGAPFGLSVVNPAKAGPFDLEKNTACDCVVVRAKIEVDPLTAALTITTDSSGRYAIPTILKGIPLQIKHVNVTITRPGFTFNPTSCNKTAIGGELTSAEGATQSLSVPFQVTDCTNLAFAPKFQAAASGKTSRLNGASLNVKLTYPNAPQGTQANIHSVKVELPKQLPSRLTTLQKACTAAQFKTNPAGCPAASIVGHAKAITPLVPVPLEGPAYFVSNGGEAFPNLIVVLQGYGVTIDLVGETFISKAGVTSSTFKTVPDQPVTSFELTLPQQPYSALAANTDLCALTRTVTSTKKVTIHVAGHRRTVARKVKKTLPAKLAMPTSFIAQNGMTLKQSTPITVSGCPKAKTTRRKKPARKS